MTAFFEMGGYAGYVWPAYAVTAIVMGGIFVASLRSMRAHEAQLRILQQSRPHRRAAGRRATTPEEVTGADA